MRFIKFPKLGSAALADPVVIPGSTGMKGEGHMDTLQVLLACTFHSVCFRSHPTAMATDWYFVASSDNYVKPRTEDDKDC
jgi:hypothetical protein